jgi:ferredoxin-NADP reductase
VEGTAVLGGLVARTPLPWREATIRAIRPETPRIKTLVLDVPGWPGHAAGQHVDIRVTAEDGYQAQRSYSIASGPGSPDLEPTVEGIEDGEVSPYLTEDARPGDGFGLRGPIGGYYVWDPARDEPLTCRTGTSSTSWRAARWT